MTTHIATIGTAADVVTGDTCDLTIYRAKAEATGGYDGELSTEYIADGDSVSVADLTVPLDDVDRDDKAMAEADEKLTALGYIRVSNWVQGDNALYAEVDAADEEQLIELTYVAAQIDSLNSRRDLLVTSLMGADVARKRIAAAARISEPRLYQIRDGR